jgi:CHRD domain
MNKLIDLAALAGMLISPALVLADGGFLRARLTGFQEVPSVATVARGELLAKIADDEQSIEYKLTYEGLQGNVTQGHIHISQRHVNGGIVLWFCGTQSNPGPTGTPMCTLGSGEFTGKFVAADVQAIGGANVSQQVAAGEIAKVIAALRAGAAYTNVHTDLSPGGEIRGQIRPVDRDKHK